MRLLVTTENCLRNIFRSPTSIWNLLINKQDKIIISTESADNTFDNNLFLQRLHNKQIGIFPMSKIVKEIPHNPEYLDALSDSIFLLEIPQDQANELSRDYGVCCISSECSDPPFFTNEGWYLETTDPDPEKEKSWDYFYKGVNRNCTSALIIDRYLFSKQWNKDSGYPNDEIEDCCYNLKSIMDNIIPFEVEDDKFVLTIVFNYKGLIKQEQRDRYNRVRKDVNGRVLYDYYTFAELVRMIEQIKNEIYRPFKYDVEIISVNNRCKYYDATHDRYIITNFHITTATHKLVAFTEERQILYEQLLTFYYIYSAGLRNPKSSLPITTKERVQEAISKLIIDSTPDTIKYALNGTITEFDIKNIRNKLLKDSINK